MAARAIAKARPDWQKIISQIHEAELPTVNKLKSQVDSCVTKVASLPENLPKIDWSHYKKHASDPKLVEELEKSYSSLKFEAPKAPEERLNFLKLSKQQDEARFKKFVGIADSFVESAAVVKVKFEKMIPVKDMNEEDWALTFPQWSFSIENPSCAPHFGRSPGLNREEAAAYDQPDPVPYATPTAWKDWEERKKKFYS